MLQVTYTNPTNSEEFHCGFLWNAAQWSVPAVSMKRIVPCPRNVCGLVPMYPGMDQYRCMMYKDYLIVIFRSCRTYVRTYSHKEEDTQRPDVVVPKNTNDSEVANRSHWEEESWQFVLIAFARKRRQTLPHFRSADSSLWFRRPFVTFLWTLDKWQQFAARVDYPYGSSTEVGSYFLYAP